jgi:class 3 adenylate cyclase/tetratricopeptide (TPR) repeat protein
MSVCGGCGQENPAAARFCLSCGRPLRAPQAREERKVVTVVFCDLVGFTAQSDNADPEDVRARLLAYHVRVRREVERYGGAVDKFIGDGIMAVFGAPAAHEDDPERAVRSALEMLHAVKELNGTDPGLDLQIRVGVMTGEAVVVLGDRESEAVVGDVVNTAARLEGLAPAGGVLVGETTWRATRRAIAYRAAGSVVAKGKAEPLPVWEALEPIARLGVDVGSRGRTPLVGRQGELGRLGEALARVRADRAPRQVTLVGAPGIGKSRLVAELLAAVDAEAELTTWRQGRSLPYGEGVTFWALGEMIKAQAGILESDDAGATRAKLAAMAAGLLADPAEARWVEGHLRPLVGLAGDAGGVGLDRQHEAFAAWRRLLEALAAQGPTVLVFEDLHWADDALLDFVEHLLDWSGDVPLLVVAAARPELLARRPGWGARPNADLVQVGPLGEHDTARLLAALLDTSVLPAELQAALLERAGGNPLYAEEYVRMLTDRGLLDTRRPGRAVEADALPLPETVQGLIAARVDALGAEEKAVLADAAVVGTVVWLGALAALAGRPAEAVRDHLQVLEARDFLRAERRSAVAGESQYSFRHVLLRDVAYRQIPRAARADKHRRAAEWIASLTPDRAEDRAELLAHHYSRALEFARAARREDTAMLAGRARVALGEAGDRATALHAFDAAARFYAAALELAEPGDPARPRWLFGLGQARMHAELAGTELLAEAADALGAAGDRERAAEAMALLGRLLRRQGHGQEGMRHLREAAALLAGAPASPSKGFVLAQLAGAHIIGGESAEAVEAGRAAFAIADALDLDGLRAEALQWIGAGRLDRGDRGGVDDLERAAAIAVRANSPAACTIVANLATTRAGFGDLRRAVELHAEARRLAERFGHASQLRYLGVEDAWDRYLQGRWDDALALADAWIAEVEAGSPHYMESTCRVVRGRVRLARGDLAGALADADAAAALVAEAEDLVGLHETLGLRICVLLADGQVPAAEATAAELLTLIRDQEDAGMTADWSADITDALARLGRGPELAGLLAGLEPTPWLEGALAIAEGDPERAAAVYARMGSLPDEALARLRAAALLTAAGHPSQARPHLARALDFYRSVGARALTVEAEALLAAPA